MSIENKFSDGIKDHFDSLRSMMKNSEEGVWDILEMYMQKNPDFKEELDENGTNVIEAGHYFLGNSIPKQGLIRESHKVVYSEMFGNKIDSPSDSYNNY